MRLIDADVLKQHIDKLPALPDGNFAGTHRSLKALINMQPTVEPSTNCSEIPDSCNAENVEAIPTAWIEAEIKKLRDMDNGFASLSAGQIEAMLKKWREEQAPTCGPDYCEIGGTHND